MHGLFLLLILFEQSLGQMANHKNCKMHRSQSVLKSPNRFVDRNPKPKPESVGDLFSKSFRLDASHYDFIRWKKSRFSGLILLIFAALGFIKIPASFRLFGLFFPCDCLSRLMGSNSASQPNFISQLRTKPQSLKALNSTSQA